MLDLGAAGGLTAYWHLLRTAFSVGSDQVRSGACSQAQFTCLHAILPPQRTHATSPYQHSALSLGNRSSHASQLMHAISCIHNTHFEHITSHALLICVLCAAHLVHLDSRGIRSSGRPEMHLESVRRRLQVVLACVGAAPRLELYCAHLCTHTTLHTLQCNLNGKMLSFQIRKYILDLHPKLWA